MTKHMVRFLTRLLKFGKCKIYTGCIAPDGYGNMYFPSLPIPKFRKKKNGYYPAHVIAFVLAGRGHELTPDKPFVLHKFTCSRACCEETHLYAGSYQDNADDRTKAGTLARGQTQWKSKLRPSQVRFIRRKAGKMSQRELARKFHVSHGLINFVQQRRVWKHV